LRVVLPVGAAAAAERILLGSGAVARRHVEMMRRPATLRLYELAERLTGRGQVLWFGLRKRWFADVVETAIQNGARQVLVVGGGLDPLASLAAQRHPDVLFVEIDAPATAAAKVAGIRSASLERPNLVISPVDLTETPLSDALRKTPWQRTVRSIVVAEGVLTYVPPDGVRTFFNAVRSNTGPASRVAFSAVNADAGGRASLGPLSGLIRVALRLAGEPLLWVLRAGEVSTFLSGVGFRVIDQPDNAAIRARYLTPAGLADEPMSPYEYFVLGEVAS
jgi:methyltransferase (TIGR00027 family)